MSNNVSHPLHYNSGRIEVIEALEDWKLEPHEWNTVKYVARAGRKNPETRVEDLEKAVWYLNRKIELLKAAKENREPKRPNDMVPQRGQLATKDRVSISVTDALNSELPGRQADTAKSVPSIDRLKNLYE